MENVSELARKFTDGGRMAVVWRDFKPDIVTLWIVFHTRQFYTSQFCTSYLRLSWLPAFISERHSGALLTTSKLRVERLYGLKLVVHPSSLAVARPTCTPISKIMNGGMSVLQSRMAFISRRRAAATREI